MPTLVVSDIHLGDPRRSVTADALLCALLMSKQWRRVVLLGDVFDLWAAPLAEINKQHATVLSVLDSLKCPIFYVPGNHDSAFAGLSRLESFRVVWPSYQFVSGDKVITLAHGDTYDETPETVSKFGACVTRLTDSVAQWFAGPGVSMTRTVLRSFANAGLSEAQYAIPLYERAARDLSGDVIVLGHTHLPMGPRTIADKIVVNSGDFGPQHTTYVVIEDGQTELHSIES